MVPLALGLDGFEKGSGCDCIRQACNASLGVAPPRAALAKACERGDRCAAASSQKVLSTV